MFDSSSRYAHVDMKVTQIRGSDGVVRNVQYVQRRIIPPVDETLSVIEHTVTQGERLDNITSLYLGDPLQFWRICDANNVLRPDELTDSIGRSIIIVLPHL